ncbi:hypothetical protein HDU76_004421, partial [Blyttiomyces sp. JEL0837]
TENPLTVTEDDISFLKDIEMHEHMLSLYRMVAAFARGVLCLHYKAPWRSLITCLVRIMSTRKTLYNGFGKL